MTSLRCCAQLFYNNTSSTKMPKKLWLKNTKHNHRSIKKYGCVGRRQLNKFERCGVLQERKCAGVRGGYFPRDSDILIPTSCELFVYKERNGSVRTSVYTHVFASLLLSPISRLPLFFTVTTEGQVVGDSGGGKCGLRAWGGSRIAADFELGIRPIVAVAPSPVLFFFAFFLRARQVL